MQDPGIRASIQAMLRQVTIGLSVHRLYPDDPQAGAFLAAVDRIRAALEDVLVGGPVRVEVRSGRFAVDGELLKPEGIDRLAHACFERRVEYVGFDAVPTPEEFATWFALLSTDRSGLEHEGGMEAALQARGVTSIRATAGVPEPVSGEEVPEDLLGLAGGGDADDPQDDPDLELALLPEEGGIALYDRLAGLAATLPDDGSVRTTFFQRAGWLVDALPITERAAFGRRLFDRLTTEIFAERFAGHLTDVALAALVADVARQEGRDAVELAAQVGTAAERHATLHQLLAAAAGEGVGRAVAPGASSEEEALRDGFPATDAAGQALARTALLDVLLNDPREEQLGRILDNAATQIAAAVRRGDVVAVQDLLTVFDTARDVGPARLAPRFGQPRAQALSPEVVTEAFSRGGADGRVAEPSILAPFGGAAVEPLLGALAESAASADRARTAGLVEALVAVARAHLDVLQQALGRRSPEVVARLVPAIGRSEDAAVLPVLTRLAAWTEPVVLRAVVDALVRQEPGAAGPAIVGVARRAADSRLRRHCLDALAALPDAAGRPHLQALATTDAGATVPLLTRWRARRLARTLGGRP